MTALLPVIALCALVLATAVAIVQHALTECSRGRLEELAAKSRDATAPARITTLLDDVPGHHASIGLWRVGATFAYVLAAAAWSMNLAPLAEGDAGLLSTSPGAIATLAGLLAIFWLLTMALPGSIAEHTPERAVLATSRVLRLAYVLLIPIRPPLRILDESVRRLAGPGDQTPAEQLEQEILDAVEEHGLGDDIGEEERDMLEKVVEFRTTTVEQVMTPRTDVQALEYSDDLEAVKSVVIDHGHSRVPVYEGNLDHVTGLLYAKDLLRWITTEGNDVDKFRLREILRPVIFVPAAKTVRELLTELLAQRVHVAMVADEYGGTSGLVTIEDIIEEIFGEIADEYDTPDQAAPGVEIDSDNAHAYIDAKTDIDDANDILKQLDFELPESDAYDTVGGFVVVTLGRIPQTDDVFQHEHNDRTIVIEVLEAEPTRVKRIRVALALPEDQDAPQEEATRATDGNNDNGSSQTDPAATTAEREAS